MTQSNFFNDLASAMQELGFSSDVPLEIAIGGTQIYEIEGAGTKWAPEKGTRNYNNDAFIVIRKPRPVVSFQPSA
jgi:hypothetical protein